MELFKDVHVELSQILTENIKDFNNLSDAWNNKTYNKIRNEWFEGKIPNSCISCNHYIPYTNLKKVTQRKFQK